MLNKFRTYAYKYRLEAILLVILCLFLFIEQVNSYLLSIYLLSYFVIVAFLNNEYLQKGVLKGFFDIKKERRYLYLYLIFLSLSIVWGLSINAIVFLSIFILFALYDWDSRITAFLAIAMLIGCVVFMLMNMDNYAEICAEYVYYLLVITIFLQIIEYKKFPNKFK